MKLSRISLFAGMALLTGILFAAPTWAQSGADEGAAIEAAINTVRQDMRGDKRMIVADAMLLTDAEAKRFWPVYDKYEAELIKLNNERVGLAKDYVQRFWTMKDAEAAAMTQRFFEWQTRRNELRKKYFDVLAKATSGMTAAKFFQVEHRLDLVVDLTVASGLAPLTTKTASTEAKPDTTKQ